MKFEFTAKRILKIEPSSSATFNVEVEMAEHLVRGMLEELAIAVGRQQLLDWVEAI